MDSNIVISLIISSSSLVLGTIVFIFDRIKTQSDNQTRSALIEQKNEARFTELETKVELFWLCIEKAVPGIIHSPHTPELDKQLETFQEKNMNIEELKTFKNILDKYIEQKIISPEKIVPATLLSTRLSQKIKSFQ